MEILKDIATWILAIVMVAVGIAILGACILGPIFLKAWIWKMVWL